MTMTTVFIPTSSDPYYTQVVSLSGTDYLIEWRWNSREAAWHYSLGLTDGTWLAVGVKTVLGTLPLFQYKDERVPKGLLVAVAKSGGAVDPPPIDGLGVSLPAALAYMVRP